jgi:hypothetical protein
VTVRDPLSDGRPVSTQTLIDQRHEEANGTALKAGARRMLDILARHHPLRYTKAQWGALSSMKHTGGTFGTYEGALRRAGLVDIRDGLYGATDAGLAAAGVTPGTPMTTEEILQEWRGKLKAGARAMLDVLVDAYPASVTRDELAERTNMAVTGGTFGTYLGHLRRNALIEVNGGDVRATDVVMGGGS